MKIVYVARHSCGGNQDEEAIHHALTVLGHDVIRVNENERTSLNRHHGDFLLFHKWHSPTSLSTHKTPVVCWYFDLVDYPDITLRTRNLSRIHWMKDITPYVDLMFCTDGDWVKQDKTNKLHWLPQGADERFVGRSLRRGGEHTGILFTGTQHGGKDRTSFVDEMKKRYGAYFNHVERGYYQEQLKDMVGGSNIVVAPDGPVTDRYWSNRVFLTLGFGGFLLHPYCSQLTTLYEEGEGVLYYDSRADLHALIADYSRSHRHERNIIMVKGLEKTLSHHLYRHRCEQMLKVIHEKLGIA